MERPVAEGATLHFIDDRYETMHAIAEQAPDLLQRWVQAAHVHSWRTSGALQCATGDARCALVASANPPCPSGRRRRWTLY